MICPNCGHDNLPGSEECASCGQDLTQLDRPVASNRVERSLMEDSVGKLCAARPIVIPPTSTVQEAINAMLGPSVGAVLIVDGDQQLLGIFSERDLLVKLAGHDVPFDQLEVSDFMTPDPEVVSADATLAFALHKMDIGGYRHLPVVKDGKPIGVISVRDMLRHFTTLCKDS
jgi:CBS domain-containing protein